MLRVQRVLERADFGRLPLRFLEQLGQLVREPPD